MTRNSTKISRFFLLAFAIISTSLFAKAQDSSARNGHPEILTANGSTKGAYCIFTNPAQDCSNSMNISWASPQGIRWSIELTDENTGKTYTYDYEDSMNDVKGKKKAKNNEIQYDFPFFYRCETFNDIPSKLHDKTSVIEKHIFDKHGYELFDLDPNHEYSYRIITVDEATQKKEYSDIHRFHTAGAPSWKAAIISDFHHYSPSKGRIESAMGMLDMISKVSGGFDWVLSPGDQAAHGGSFNFWTELADQANYKDYMWASVQGNHDHMASNKKTTDNFFRDSHFFPYNGYKGQEGVAYWFRYGDALFLMLNSEAMVSDVGLEEAKRWMEKVVNENKAKYIIAVTHYNWMSGVSGANFQMERFYDTFDKLGVDLAISGHNHVYLRTAPLRDIQPVEPGEGTVYVVASSSDNDRGRDKKSNGANSNLIKKRWTEGQHTVGGMLMDVNPKRIQLTLYNRYGKVEDSFTIPARR